jgi:GNAT superfamily N-acetyltransferase
MEIASERPVCTVARTDAEILACLPTLIELRPHLMQSTFLEQIRRQERHGFTLMVMRLAGEVIGVVGFRISECLGCGVYMYIDDFVIASASRRKGMGELFFRDLVAYARSNDCTHIMLDSAMHREPSHALYRKLGMSETCRHFELSLT